MICCLMLLVVERIRRCVIVSWVHMSSVYDILKNNQQVSVCCWVIRCVWYVYKKAKSTCFKRNTERMIGSGRGVGRWFAATERERDRVRETCKHTNIYNIHSLEQSTHWWGLFVVLITVISFVQEKTYGVQCGLLGVTHMRHEVCTFYTYVWVCGTHGAQVKPENV